MCNGCLINIKTERIQNELEKIANEGGIIFANAIQLMNELNILKDILPEMDKLFYLEHSKNPIQKVFVKILNVNFINNILI